MKNGAAHGGSFIQRWLSKSSNATSSVSYGGSEMESMSTDSFSPPPLTDSSSTTDSSAAIRTPMPSTVASSHKHSSSRYAIVKTPCTPPTRYTELPSGSTSHNLAVSLLPNAQRPSMLVSTRQCLKLHRLLSYCHPMRHPLVWDIASSPSSSYIRQSPPTTLSTAVIRHLKPPSHASGPPHVNPEKDLSQYATTPPVSSMQIISDLMPWTIHVRGRNMLPGDPDSFIRVIDVLDAIHKSLRVGVPSGEWNRTPKLFRDKVKKTYLDRCRASRAYTLNGYEEKQGVRRVDWFVDSTVFLGLMVQSPDGECSGGARKFRAGEESTWVMMVRPR